MLSSTFANPNTKPALDESLYPLERERSSLKVFQQLTGIVDEEELKRHILRVQEKAYGVYGYPCIRAFSFVRPKVLRIPAYREALAISEKNKDAIFLDMGCCFGTDARKAAFDGWPAQNIIGSDLHKGFWECGHELFNTSPETFPVAFVGGDVFDAQLIQPRSPTSVGAESTRPADLRALTSLTPLQGHISAIHASSFFHLFSEEKQLEAARQLASLLSPKPGSIIFGSHMGERTKGPQQVPDEVKGVREPMFCHSPETWKREVWDGPVFEAGTVDVKAELRPIEMPSLYPGGPEVWPSYLLLWSVTRL